MAAFQTQIFSNYGIDTSGAGTIEEKNSIIIIGLLANILNSLNELNRNVKAMTMSAPINPSSSPSSNSSSNPSVFKEPVRRRP